MDDEPEQSFTKVASGTAWNLFGTFFIKILSFLYTVFLARTIAQQDVGVFYLALGLLGFFGFMKDFGLPYSLLRFVPFYEAKGEHGKAADLFKKTLIVVGAAGLFLSAFVWAAAEFIGMLYQNSALADALKLLAAFLFIDNVGRALGTFVQSKTDIKTVQLVSTVQIFLKFGLTVLFVYFFGPGLFAICAGYVLSYLFSYPLFIPSVINYIKLSPRQNQALSYFEIFGEIAPFGLMLTVIYLFNTIMSSADRVFLGYLLPPDSAAAAVAVYSFAVMLANNAMIFPGAVSSIFLPVISKLIGKGDMQNVRRQIGVAQRWVLFITLPMAAAMAAYSAEMLAVFFGSAYAKGGMAMTIFIFGLMFPVFSLTISLALAAMRLLDLEMKVAAVAAVSNIILNAIFIPLWKIEGAALATAIGFAIWGALMFKYGKERIGFQTSAEAYKLLFAGFLVFILAVLFKPAVEFAGHLPKFSGEFAPYFAKLWYLGMILAVGAVNSAFFAAFSVFFKCFWKEDLQVWSKFAQRLHLPSAVVSFGERLLKSGMAK